MFDRIQQTCTLVSSFSHATTSSSFLSLSLPLDDDDANLFMKKRRVCIGQWLTEGLVGSWPGLYIDMRENVRDNHGDRREMMIMYGG